jgi:hypothetical protein
VVLDARLQIAGDTVLDHIKRVVRRQALAQSSEQVQFRFATLGPEAGLIGAALAVLDRHFEIPVLRPPKIMIDRSLQIEARRNARRRMGDDYESEAAPATAMNS